MNKIDFTQPGGYPLDQDTFGFMQMNAQMVAQLAALCGPFAILSGCEQTGSNVSNGYIILNGEILPFIGGAIQAKVIIQESKTLLNYEDGVQRPSLIERVATFGDDGVTNVLWASFKRNTPVGLIARIEALEDLPGRVKALEDFLEEFHPWLPKDVKEIDCTQEYITANFDASGLGKNERLGWAICNGNNGTRNRQGRVGVQYSPYEFEFSYLGQASGEKAHALTEAENAPHTHPIDKAGNGSGPTARYSTNGSSFSGGGSTGSSGQGQSHNNLQPYIVSLFIQKL
jgi:hypothetical protein